MKTEVKVGLLGLGTVGGGTAIVLLRNAEEITRRTGHRIVVEMAAALEPERARELGLAGTRITTNAQEVVNDKACPIIIELIGGYEPARTLVLQAIANGKHIVTANKALIARHGQEIFEAARKQGVVVAYEAAVAGGIPIIKAIREGLSANRIQWVAGIINGTGNFILTEMRDRGRSFDDALKEAQALGYAEADPDFDVEGIDAAHKLTILAAISFGIPLQFDACYTEGISKVQQEDVVYAEELGYRIKHLGVARRTGSGIEMRVHPTLIPEKRLIANVNGVMNAVLVMADATGPTMYYGAGAGAEPTASAVVADIIDVIRESGMASPPENRIPISGFQGDGISDTPVLPMAEIETSYYLRMLAADRAGVMADVTAILGAAGISIEAMIQKDPVDERQAKIIMLTHHVKEQQMDQAIKKIEALDSISGEVTRIRMESLG